MIKSKKLAAFVLTTAFTVSSLFSAYATSITSPSATTTTVETATSEDGTTYTVVNVTTGETVDESTITDGYIYIEDTDEEPDLTGEDEDVTAAVQEQLDALIATLAEQGISLVNSTTGETVTVDDVVVASKVEINWKDLGVHVDEGVNFPIWVEFSVPGATEENFVGAMHKPESGDWQFEEYEFTSDGNIKVKLNSFSPIAFLVVAEESTEKTPGDTLGGYIPYLAALAVIAATGCVVTYTRRKKNA